jgi:hypothetical protein
MKTLGTLGILACLGLLAAASAPADDDWKDWLRDDYKNRRRALDRAEDRREDDLKLWHDWEEERLEAARRDAWRHTRGRERISLLRAFREQERALDREYDRLEDAADDWHDRQEDLLEDWYDAAKDGHHGRGRRHGLGLAPIFPWPPGTHLHHPGAAPGPIHPAWPGAEPVTPELRGPADGPHPHPADTEEIPFGPAFPQGKY